MSQGTSQNDRIPVALDPDYFNIDDRSLEDLFLDARQMAGALPFYDSTENGPDGSWLSFFNEKEVLPDPLSGDKAGTLPPHLGLFIAFAKLYGYPQDQLNSLTASHLQFFYNNILGQEKKPPKPDKVHLFFQLARNVPQYLLPEQTTLPAGKDPQGNDILFTIDRPAFISQAVISQLKAVKSDKKKGGRIRAFPVVNSSDGLGEPLDDKGWNPFGCTPATGPNAEIGFGVESPLLFLDEGIRTIRLSFSLNSPDKFPLKTLKADEFTACLTGPEGWFEKEVHAVETDKDQLIFSIRLTEADDPVTGQNPELHGPKALTQGSPALRMILKEGTPFDRYDLLQSLRVNGVTIRTDVEKARSLRIRNDFGDLDAGKAFHPFGYSPVKGANLYIGLEETFPKPVSSLSFHIKWKGVPDSLKAWYEGYRGATNSLVQSNEDFRIKAAVRSNGKWVATSGNPDHDGEFALFSDTLNIELDPVATHKISADKALKDGEGMIRLTLSSPEDAFGHTLYPSVYAKAIMSQMKDQPAPIPNEPYTPVIESIDVSYSAEVEPDHFYYVKPFGIELARGTRPALLSGEFQQNGHLYLGIDHLTPPQQLAVFFDILQGAQGEKPDPEFFYLRNDGWTRLPENQILSDSTLGLKQTGILLLNTPSDMSRQHPSMPAGKHWLRISVPDHAENFDPVMDVRTNAVTATRMHPSGTHPAGSSLQPGTISKLSVKRSEIKKTEQPYPSFDGREPESDRDYYTRVSETLRHKNRGVTEWDMERLVLESFPKIYKVSCVRHRNENGRIAPGHVHVIVIPYLDHHNSSGILKPMVPESTLSEIRSYLSKTVSSNVNLHVTNPQYEEIKIIANVSFNQQVDAGYYVKQLQKDLQQFLSPWAFRDETAIQLGGRLYRSSIIEFIETRQYVSFIANIRLLRNGRLTDREEISHDAHTLIVSAETHDIEAVEPDKVVCQTNQGVEQMIVDINFEVQ